MKLLIPLVLGSLALGACADNTPGGKVAHERHENFEAIGDAFKAINDQLKSGAPDLASVKAETAKIAGLAPQVKTWFPAGSGPQDGKRTDAKAEVWSKPAEFAQAHTRFVDAARALQAVVATGDMAAIGASTKTLGASCKGCHDKFKED
jgi:cytochrome c556